METKLNKVKLDKAKEIIKDNIEDARYGIFNSRNIVGDEMDNIYEDDELSIDICYGWEYFEVFGLSDLEFDILRSYYNELLEE